MKKEKQRKKSNCYVNEVSTNFMNIFFKNSCGKIRGSRLFLSRM